MNETTQGTARLSTSFLLNSIFEWTPQEAKIILFLISKIDPDKEDKIQEVFLFEEELEMILGEDKKKSYLLENRGEWNGQLLGRKIEIPSNIEIAGQKMRGIINWFQHVIPINEEDPSKGGRYLFAEDLRPFLLEQNNYIEIPLSDVLSLSSSIAIRLYLLLKALQDQSPLHYSLDRLRVLLSIEKRFSNFSDFEKQILAPVGDELHQHTSIQVKWKESEIAGEIILKISS